ncbi:toxin-antitoxin system HicB family antitoxin [Actinomycetospora aeridis]|uniref:Toxin-antitoxin system HicB family antitoxin n=1 Tax=Actinomycetospora aeridis TaxID=3129231 RepID=A0ABU8NBX0_9PSEU
MDLTPYVASLRDDLAAAAAVGDEATTRAGSSLAAALEPAVRLALMNALSDLAGEVSEQLGDRTVSLRLSGREVQVVVDRDPNAEDGFFAGPSSSPFAGTPGGGPGNHRHTPPPPPGFPGFGGQGFGGQGFGGQGGPDVGDISRMTLRLVDQIKGQAEKAAASQGMSLNSWIGQAVQGALKGQYGGHRGGPWGHGDESGDKNWDENWRKGWDQGRPSSPSTPSSPSSGDDAPKDAPKDAPRKDEGDEGGGDVSGWVRG